MDEQCWIDGVMCFFYDRKDHITPLQDISDNIRQNV